MNKQPVEWCLLLSLIACGVLGGTARAEGTSEDASEVQLVEQLPEHFRPAFTRETVIKLNAIVRRSFAVYGEYDALVQVAQSKAADAGVPNASDETKAQAQAYLTLLDALKGRSKAALADMVAAAAELQSGDEVYNSEILAGMIDFVQDVERLVSMDYDRLETTLQAALEASLLGTSPDEDS